MEFRKRSTVRNGYCFYLAKEEAERLVDWGPDSSAVVWDMRKLLMNHFEKEAGRGSNLPETS